VIAVELGMTTMQKLKSSIVAGNSLRAAALMTMGELRHMLQIRLFEVSKQWRGLEGEDG
jgi:hypothetical protein